MREDLEGLMQLKELKLRLQLDLDDHFAYPILFFNRIWKRKCKKQTL